MTDLLTGGTGADFVHAGRGDDIISAGTGTDTLNGGDGTDAFVFLSVAETGLGADEDTFVRFESSVDKIDLGGVGGLHFIGGAGFTGAAGKVRVMRP